MGRARNVRPETWHTGLALALTVALAACLFTLFRFPATWYHVVAAWLAAVNVSTLGYYGYDKSCAQAGRRRIPEVVLHGLAFLGGTLGAYLGMRIFRHKTLKGPFRLVFWWIAVLQVLLLGAVVYRLVAGRA